MKVIVFIISLLLSSSVLTSTNEDSVIYESFDFEIRYFNAISKSAVILQEYFNKYPESDHEKIIKTNTFINNVLRKELYEIADVYAEQYKLSPTHREIFFNHLKKLKLNNLVTETKNLFSKRSYFLRRFGFGAGLAFAVGNLLNVVTPFLLSQVGAHLLIPASLAFPYGTVLVALTKPYDFLTRWRKEKNALGMNYSEYVKMRREIRKRLSTTSDFDLLIPVKINGAKTDKLLTINNSGFIDKLLDYFNLNRDRSNYYTISAFMKRVDLEDKYTRWIARQKKLSDTEKTVLLIHHLFEIGDEEVQSKFITEFSSFFSSRPKLPRTYMLKAWTKKLLSAKSAEDIAKIMTLIPPGTPPLVVIQIWEDLAISQFIRHIPMKTGGYNKLKRELEVLRGISSTKSHPEKWNQAFAKLFNQKIGSVISEYKSICHKSQKDLFHFLLNNPL